MEARVGGANLRQIAAELGVSPSTVHEDMQAELLTLSEADRFSADGHRELELQRTDLIVYSLDLGIQAGDVAAVRVAIHCSDHRARMLGLY